MPVAESDENMVKYQFQAEDEDWQEWKETVPRSKSLEQRINELIEADTQGRVTDEETFNAIRNAIDDAEAAAERGDGPALQEALQRAREAIDDA